MINCKWGSEMKKGGTGKVFSILAILLSGVLWGVISVFIRPLSAAGLSATQICFVRLLIAAPVFSLVTLCVSPSLFRIRLRDIWMFLGTGIVSIVLFNICYFYTIIHSEASVAVVLLYTSPVFVMLVAVFLFKEKVRAQKIVALVMTLVGCLLVSGVIGSGAGLRPIVALTGLLSGLFYAMYSVFGKLALKKYDTLTLTTYTFLFAFIGALPFSDVSSTFAILIASPKLWWWCAGIGIFSTALPFFFYTVGLKKVEPSRASILAAVEPLVGSLVGIAFYGESHGILKIIGIVFVVGAIFVLNLPKREKRVRMPKAADDLVKNAPIAAPQDAPQNDLAQNHPIPHQ